MTDIDKLKNELKKKFSQALDQLITEENIKNANVDIKKPLKILIQDTEFDWDLSVWSELKIVRQTGFIRVKLSFWEENSNIWDQYDF